MALIPFLTPTCLATGATVLCLPVEIWTTIMDLDLERLMGRKAPQLSPLQTFTDPGGLTPVMSCYCTRHKAPAQAIGNSTGLFRTSVMEPGPIPLLSL